MTQLTRQEAFDKALFGIRKQGYQQSVSGSVCRYRGCAALKCGIGHCISDEDAKTWDLETTDSSIRTVFHEQDKSFSKYFHEEDIDFLEGLQFIHDVALFTSALKFEEDMQEFAEQHTLKYTPPDTPPTSAVLASPYFQLGG